MKRLIIALVAMALLADGGTAQGTVILFFRDVGNWTAEVNYDASSEAELVRAVALDIKVDGPATIDSISDYNPRYQFFDDTPIADPLDPGALGGLGTNGITVEFFSLYFSPADAPLPAGTLLRIGVNPHDGSEVNVGIALNAIRGGIVMEDVSFPEVDLRGCTLVPEPGTILLLGLGGFGLLRRRRQP